MDNNEEHLPKHAINDYRNSPVKNKTLEEQINYWKSRAKFMENKAYFYSEIIKGMQEDDPGELWKHADD